MKTSLIVTFLAASLAANAWLVLRRAPADATASAAPGAPANASPATRNQTGPAAAAAVARPIVWTAPATSPAALHEFAAELRRAGFPPRVVAGLLSTLVRDEAQAQFAQVPFWKLTQPDADLRQRQFAVQDEVQRRLEEILGADGTPAALLDSVQRAHRFGSLPDAKVNALLRIERDYQELMAPLNTPAGPTTTEEFAARSAQRQAIEKEQLADIAAALTPEEFAAWELRSSEHASRVQNAARNLTLTEDEYRALVAAQKEFEPNAGSFVISFTSNDPRLSDRLAMNEKIRAALGEERFDSYLRGADFHYANVAKFTDQQPAAVKAQTYAIYQLQLEAQAAFAESQNLSSGGRVTTMSAQREKFTALNERLDALLGPEAAAAYRNSSSGSFFKMFTPPTTRPATTPATPPRN